MARAETLTLLPLDRYSEIMRINSSHFNQMNGPKAPILAGCSEAIIWDQDAREDLAWTIAQAEEMIANELSYWPSPKFITEERKQMATSGVRYDWRNAELTTRWGEVECYGTETLTLKQADAGVEYTNSDNNPFDKENQALIGTAIYSDLPACDEECEVAVFFRVADGAKDAADPRWEIKPLKVDIDGTTMRITADSSLFVRPNLWELTEAECKGSDDSTMWRWNFEPANLVSMVDVYCRTVNKQLPVTLMWDGVCTCTGVCQHKTQDACALSVDPRRGFFIPRPATWNGTTNIEAGPTHAFAPESVKVNYRAGYPLTNCRMNPQLERAIVKLTNVLLPAPPCGFCDAAEVRWKNDRKDIDPLTPEAASMPWDLYSQGALEAWRIVKRLAHGRGGKLGRGYR